MGGEVGDAERLVRIGQVEPEVRDARPVRGAHLGRADVEAAEDLARVGRDDRHGPAVRADRLGEPDRELGLAGGRRAGDDDEGRGGSPRRSRPDERASQRVRAGVLDPDHRPRARRAPRRRRGGPACCRASGRRGGCPPPPARRRRARARAAACTASTRTSTSRPSHASLRSSPIASWTASSVLSRRRLSAAGTSSSRCVAGVPGRGE